MFGKTEMVKDGSVVGPTTPKTGNVAAAKKRSLALLKGALKGSKKGWSAQTKKKRKGNGTSTPKRSETEDSKGASPAGSGGGQTIERTRVNLVDFSFGELPPETKTIVELQATAMSPFPKRVTLSMLVVTGKHRGPIGLFVATGADAVSVGSSAACSNILGSLQCESMSGQYCVLCPQASDLGAGALASACADPGMMGLLKRHVLSRVDFIVEFRSCIRQGADVAIVQSLTMNRVPGTVGSTQGLGEELSAAFGMDTTFYSDSNRQSASMTSLFAQATDAMNLPRYTLSLQGHRSVGKQRHSSLLHYSVLRDTEHMVWRALLASGILCVGPPEVDDDDVGSTRFYFQEPFSSDGGSATNDDGRSFTHVFSDQRGICELFVTPGDHVTKGQLVCKLHNLGHGLECTTQAVQSPADGEVLATTIKPIVAPGDYIALVGTSVAGAHNGTMGSPPYSTPSLPEVSEKEDSSCSDGEVSEAGSELY